MYIHRHPDTYHTFFIHSTPGLVFYGIFDNVGAVRVVCIAATVHSVPSAHNCLWHWRGEGGRLDEGDCGQRCHHPRNSCGAGKLPRKLRLLPASCCEMVASLASSQLKPRSGPCGRTGGEGGSFFVICGVGCVSHNRPGADDNVGGWWWS